MPPLVPRLHLFEIDDQPWFPKFLRSRVQDALTETWATRVPILQSMSPAHIAAKLLMDHLKQSTRTFTYIDSCAGSGGPTPMIELAVNSTLTSESCRPAPFVLTDIYPNVESWARASKKGMSLTYEPESIDATNIPRDLIQKYTQDGSEIFRLYNLAFHHFDDRLARAVLKNTVETSHGFAYARIHLTAASFLQSNLLTNLQDI